MSFSGYPGLLASGDDWYLLDSGLAVMETTLQVFNYSTYGPMRPQHRQLTWLRTVLANRMARDGAQWTQLFGTLNSGTYNNAW